jgi:hypothetical protein
MENEKQRIGSDMPGFINPDHRRFSRCVCLKAGAAHVY